LALAGVCTLSVPDPAVNASGTMRWFVLKLCVVVPSFISTTSRCSPRRGLDADAGAVRRRAGAEVMTGRAPLNR
jgi:hypothetical protein